MDENKIKQIIGEYLEALIKSDRIVIEKSRLQLLDGRHIQVGLTTGTKIGTAITQKLSLWGVTPVVQPASGNQAALSLDTDVTGGDTVDKTAIDNNFSSIQTLVNQLRTDLIAAGVIKGSA